MHRRRGNETADFSYNPDGTIRSDAASSASKSALPSCSSPGFDASERHRRGDDRGRPTNVQPPPTQQAPLPPPIQLPWRIESDRRFFQAPDSKVRRYTAEYYEFQEFYKRFLLHKGSSGFSLGGNPAVDASLGSDLLQMLSGTESVRLPSTIEQETAILNEAISFFGQFLEKKRASAGSKISADRKTLPVYRYREEVLTLIRANQVTIIAAETGAGKSTQVPQYLLEDGFSRVVCTQPRRIACLSLAQRVKQERLSWPGSSSDDVGYQIRFEKSHSSARQFTRGSREAPGDENSRDFAGPKLLFLTEGILMRQIRTDPLLQQYDLIIIDEVHERHAMVDFLLGLLRRVLPARPQLKLVLMSATIQADLFSKYFLDAPLITIPGKTFPVDIEYYPFQIAGKVQEDVNLVDDRLLEDRLFQQEQIGYVPSIPAPSMKFDGKHYLSILQKIDAEYPPDQRGHLLIFMSGYNEITALAFALEEYAKETQKWIILKLHSTLSMKQQDRVFMQSMPGVRKCIISTNIAETSVTLPEIRFIIDSGRMKELEWDPSCRMQRLVEVWISQASAKQRAGRAGRTGPGKCWRLFGEQEFAGLNEYSTAELVRGLALDQIILQMKSMNSVDSMAAIDPVALESQASNPQSFANPSEMPLAVTPSNKDISDPRLFNFLQRPSTEYIEQSLQLLRQVGALDNNEHITILGNALSLLPVDVILGKMLVFGCSFQMVDWTMMMAAGLSVQSPFLREDGTTANPSSRGDGFTDEYDRSVGFRYGSVDWVKEKQKIQMSEGDPFTLIQLLQQWLTIQTSGSVKSKTWCSKLSVEEQRLYEMVKLMHQFKSIVGEEYEEQEDQDGARKKRPGKTQEQHQVYDQYQRQKHTAKEGPTKLLSTTEHESDNDDEHQPDLLSLEFRSRHDLNSLYASFARLPYFGLKHAEKVLLQLLLCSGLYPNIAVPDDANSSRRASDHVFHTKLKRFVLLHPTSVFAKKPEWVPSFRSSAAFKPKDFHGSSTSHNLRQMQMVHDGLMDITAVDDPNQRTDGKKKTDFDPEEQTAPNYPSFLCYVQLMETSKPYLMNVFHVPALIAALLFGKIDTNPDMSVLIVDDWIVIELKSRKRFTGQSQSSTTRVGTQILRRMIKFREEWAARVNYTLWTRFKFNFNKTERLEIENESLHLPSIDETQYLSEELLGFCAQLPKDLREVAESSRRPISSFLDSLNAVLALDEAISNSGIYYEIDTVKDDDMETLFPSTFPTKNIPASMRHAPKWSTEREKVGIRLLPYLTLGSVHYPKSILRQGDSSNDVKMELQNDDDEPAHVEVPVPVKHIGASRSTRRVWECPSCMRTMMLNDIEIEAHPTTCEGPPKFKVRKTFSATASAEEVVVEPVLPKQGFQKPKSAAPLQQPIHRTPDDILGQAAAAAVSKSQFCPKCGKSIATPIEKLQHRKSCK